MPYIYGYEEEIRKRIVEDFPFIDLEFKHYNQFDISLRRPRRSFVDKFYYFFIEKLFRPTIQQTLRKKKTLNIQKINSDFKYDYDLFISLRPDYLKKHFGKKLLFNRSKKSVAYCIDSVDACPDFIPLIPYLDEVVVFQKKDSDNYGFDLGSNFFFEHIVQPIKNPEDKLFCFFLYDEFRVNRLNELLNFIKHYPIPEIDIRIVTRGLNIKSIHKYNFEEDSVKIQDKPFSVNDVYNEINNSKYIFEIQAKHNDGLTFRTFESLFLERKLITTNSEVLKYDFYNPNNIFVLDEHNTQPSDNFFTSEYEPVPPDILKKYSFKSWFANMLQFM